jgi:CheY-like chemotaxis protein
VRTLHERPFHTQRRSDRDYRVVAEERRYLRVSPAKNSEVLRFLNRPRGKFRRIAPIAGQLFPVLGTSGMKKSMVLPLLSARKVLWARQGDLSLADLPMRKRILVVDNEMRNRKNIAQFLAEESYEVEEADDGASAIEILATKDFDLMICDVVMPRLSAFDVINHMKARSLPTSVILITGHPDLLAAKGLGHLPAFTKPFNMYDLLHKVKEVMRD